MLKQSVLHNILLNAGAGDEGGGNNTPTPPAPVTLKEPVVIDGVEEGDTSGADELPVVPAGGLKEKVPVGPAAKLAALNAKKASANKTTGQPTAEELKEPIGNLDDLDDKGIVTETIAEKKKREDEAAAKVEKEKEKVATAKEGDDKTKAGQRDYSIFDETEQALVKTAPNALFNHLKETLPTLRNEVKALKTELENAKKGIVKIPDSYHEHPDAYVLTPEFRQYRQAYSAVTEEEQHWLEQLENVENGKAWQSIEGRDDAGNLTKSKEVNDTSIRSKDYISQQLQLARQYKNEFAAKVTDIKKNHVQTYNGAATTIRDGVKQHCPWVSNEALLKEQMEFTNPETNKIEKATVADTLKVAYNMLPTVFRNHPLAEVWANMFVVNAITQQKLRILEGQVKVKKTNVADQLEAEPAGATKGQSTAIKDLKKKEDKVVPSIDDMED